MKAKYPRRINREDMMKDGQASGSYWVKNYFGFESLGEWKNWLSQRKNRQACVDAGLTVKEAKEPIITNPAYLTGLLFGPRRRGKRYDPNAKQTETPDKEA